MLEDEALQDVRSFALDPHRRKRLAAPLPLPLRQFCRLAFERRRAPPARRSTPATPRTVAQVACLADTDQARLERPRIPPAEEQAGQARPACTCLIAAEAAHSARQADPPGTTADEGRETRSRRACVASTSAVAVRQCCSMSTEARGLKRSADAHGIQAQWHGPRTVAQTWR